MPKSSQSYRQNQLERQELLKKNKMAAGLVSDRFPGVSGIVFRMTYYQRGTHPIVMVRTMNFAPTDYAYFHINCVREECSDGGFDLTPIVVGLFKQGKKSTKGKLTCVGRGGSLAPNHASIAYEVSIQREKPQ